LGFNFFLYGLDGIGLLFLLGGIGFLLYWLGLTKFIPGKGGLLPFWNLFKEIGRVLGSQFSNSPGKFTQLPSLLTYLRILGLT